METQIEERRQLLDTFIEGLQLNKEAGEDQKPAELLAELNSTLNIPLKLTGEQPKMLKENPKAAAREIRDQLVSSIQNLTVTRLINTIEIRIGEPLNIRSEEIDAAYWGDLTQQIMSASQQALDLRIEKMVGENGQITKDLDNLLTRLTPPYSEHEIIWLLLQMPQGSRAHFDRKTHRRIIQRTNRITYVFHSAAYLEGMRTADISDRVLEHLEGALDAILTAWGSSEISRLADATLSELEEKTRLEVFEELELDEDTPLANITFSTLDSDLRSRLSAILGRRLISNVYRQLLLGVITELWVEYLTQMEALRVSIGLEAYGQRDPLVQYKSRASELFQNLQSNIRLGVISRMFTYRLRDQSNAQAQLLQEEETTADILPSGEEDSEPTVTGGKLTAEDSAKSVPSNQEKEGSRRKRHRRR